MMVAPATVPPRSPQQPAHDDKEEQHKEQERKERERNPTVDAIQYTYGVPAGGAAIIRPLSAIP